MITKIKSRIFLIIFLIKVNICSSLFGLQLDSSKLFWKGLLILMHFFFFKEITPVYLLKISITHYENGFLYYIYLLISYRHIFQIIIYFLLAAPREVNLSASEAEFYQKVHKALKQTVETILEAVLLVKSLKAQYPCHVENNLYLFRFDKYIVNLLFLYFLIFFPCKWSL